MFNWKFWKKEEKKEGRALVVPEELTEYIMRLCDAYGAAPTGQDRVARYHLWTAINRLFPDTQNGAWKIKSEPTKVTITEIVG